jgi:hypothetical protein
MKRDYYVTPKSSWFMRLFWQAAGGDRFILERATYSDQIKYFCLGGVIIATGVMAGLAGGYAFYTIFSPRGYAMEVTDYSLSTTILSVVFGILWGLMIFNIDRFIVTSTGKGDGTEAITWKEFKGAIPRIIMGGIIAVTISKPVEIRMFQTEINVKLHEKQLEAESKFIQQVNANFEKRENEISNERAMMEQERAKIRITMEGLIAERNEISGETFRRTTVIKDADGASREIESVTMHPGLRSLDLQINKLQAELDDFDENNKAITSRIFESLEQLKAEKEKELANAKTAAQSLDGLLARIQLVNEIAPWISLFITLLFMAIELTPIFFKLMLIKTPYDFLEDNVKELIKAEAGVSVIYNYYPGKDGEERDLVQYLDPEKTISRQRDILETERKLAIYALDAYEAQMKRKIDQNPEEYVRSTNS